MIYRIVADFLVILHLVFICFVIAGGLMVIKWRWIIFLHIPAAIWGILIEFYGWICPLTPWEQQLRYAGGQAGYSGGFIDHYIIPVIYPTDFTSELQVTLGIFVFLVNIIIYGWIIYRSQNESINKKTR